jgi:hypothetical protein
VVIARIRMGRRRQYRGFTIWPLARRYTRSTGRMFTLCCSIGVQKRVVSSDDLHLPRMGADGFAVDCERC